MAYLLNESAPALSIHLRIGIARALCSQPTVETATDDALAHRLPKPIKAAKLLRFVQIRHAGRPGGIYRIIGDWNVDGMDQGEAQADRDGANQANRCQGNGPHTEIRSKYRAPAVAQHQQDCWLGDYPLLNVIRKSPCATKAAAWSPQQCKARN